MINEYTIVFRKKKKKKRNSGSSIEISLSSLAMHLILQLALPTYLITMQIIVCRSLQIPGVHYKTLILFDCNMGVICICLEYFQPTCIVCCSEEL